MCHLSQGAHTPYTRGIPWVKSPERVRLTGRRDAHVGENVDTPIGQFLLIGNFRRRLARELLVYLDINSSVKHIDVLIHLVYQCLRMESQGLSPLLRGPADLASCPNRRQGRGERKHFGVKDCPGNVYFVLL